MKALLLKAVEALTKLSSYASRQTCAHDETYRGGAIWEICRDCGAKWADDEGGRPPYVEPRELIAASEAIADLEAAIREQPGEAGSRVPWCHCASHGEPRCAEQCRECAEVDAVAPLKDEGEASPRVIAYEFLHPNGHAIVDYSERTHVGHLTAEKGYKKLPLVYAPGVSGTAEGQR